MFVSAVQPRQRNAQRGGDDHVDRDRDNRRARRLSAQQRDQKGHAHETGVRKGRYQRPERCVVPAGARAACDGDGEAHHDQRAQQIDGDQADIEQLRYRRAGAKAVQHAGQCEIQHKAVEPGYRRLRQHDPARGDIAAKNQHKKRKGD